MFVMVIGGSGSGKSALVEERILALNEGTGRTCIYLATMENFGGEDQRRIDRHRALRAGKGFVTVERSCDLAHLKLPENAGSVLLECITSLAGNELYHAGTDVDLAFARLQDGLQALLAQSAHLVAVTDNVSADGIDYDEETRAYIRLMGRINSWLAQHSDEAFEVVCGIPVPLHGIKEER